MLNFDKLQNAQEQGRQRKQDYEINLAASNISLINAFKNVIFDNELKYVYAKEAAKLVSILEDRLNAFNLIVLEGEHASLDNGYDAVLFPIKIGE